MPKWLRGCSCVDPPIVPDAMKPIPDGGSSCRTSGIATLTLFESDTLGIVTIDAAIVNPLTISGATHVNSQWATVGSFGSGDVTQVLVAVGGFVAKSSISPVG